MLFYQQHLAKLFPPLDQQTNFSFLPLCRTIFLLFILISIINMSQLATDHEKEVGKERFGALISIDLENDSY